jgi:hypothetical protein
VFIMARYRSLFLFIACALVAAVHSEQGKREHHASASASALMSSPVDNEPELVRIESAIEPSRRKNNFRPVLFKNRHLEESAAIEVEYEQVCKLMVYMQAHLWYAHYVKILTTCAIYTPNRPNFDLFSCSICHGEAGSNGRYAVSSW